MTKPIDTIELASPRLHKGQRFWMNGQRWRVVYVNASRAHCAAILKQRVTIESRGQARVFVAKRRLTMDISPHSAVDLLEECVS